jgi:hypothetical protein
LLAHLFDFNIDILYPWRIQNCPSKGITYVAHGIEQASDEESIKSKAPFHKVKKGDPEDSTTNDCVELVRNFGSGPYKWWLPVPIPGGLTVPRWQSELSTKLVGFEIDCQI